MDSQQPAMGRYARILLDRWFKRSFLFQKDSRKLLRLFLQEIIPEHDFAEIKTDNVEHVNLLEDGKDVRLDVECYDSDGTRFICEVQVSPQHHFYERALYNSTLAIQKQKKSGEMDYDFPTVYFIGLMDFTMHPGADRVDFCYALHEMERLPDRPAALRQEIFKILFDSAELSNFTPDERAKYQLDMTTERDIHNQLVYARDKGMEEGMEKGLEKGRQEGRAESMRLMAEQLWKTGMSEEEVRRILDAARP